MINQATIKQEIIETCKRLHQKNILAAADGNISYKISDDHILLTPSGLAKAFLKPEDFAVVTINGDIIKGNPSSERLMHLEVYKKCPQAKCVIHAHPPTAIAWSIARPDLKELPSHCLSELILAVTRIPIVPYARPGTLAMGTHLHEFLPACRVMILARHGALCWGESLMEATNGMERLEHSAQILLYATQLGGITNLPDEEIEILYEMRRNIGERII